jgi:hypothetical protein
MKYFNDLESNMHNVLMTGVDNWSNATGSSIGTPGLTMPSIPDIGTLQKMSCQELGNYRNSFNKILPTYKRYGTSAVPAMAMPVNPTLQDYKNMVENYKAMISHMDGRAAFQYIQSSIDKLTLLINCKCGSASAQTSRATTGGAM